MNVNIYFLDSTEYNFNSKFTNELDAVDDAIKNARHDGNTAPVMFYQSTPSDLESVICSHS